MLFDKLCQNKKVEFFPLSLFTLLLLWFSYCLFQGLTIEAFTIKNLELLIWIVACIIQMTVLSKRILASPINATLKRKEKEAHSSEKPGILTRLVAFALLLVMTGILYLNTERFAVSYIVELELDIFSTYFNICAGLWLITINLQDLITIKSKFLKQAIVLISIAMGLLGVIFMLIYTSHMTEIVS